MPRVHTMLAAMGPNAKSTLPELRDAAVRGFDQGSRETSAAFALFAIGPESPEARSFVFHVATQFANTDEPKTFAINYLRSLEVNGIALPDKLTALRDAATDEAEKKTLATAHLAIQRLLTTP